MPTREQVIEWARESTGAHVADYFNMNSEELERFAALAYAAGQRDEREACAKECKSLLVYPLHNARERCAAAIRDRRD